MKAVIMAGGGGTRLWPESRKNSPKQTKPFIDDRTLLQKTFDRLLKKFKIEDIWVTAGKSQLGLIKPQIPNLPEANYSLEPTRQDTAAAIGLINTILFAKDPESSMININSDAYVADEQEYIACIDAVEKCLEVHPDFLIGIGIHPNYPETGYGYIKKGKEFFTNDNKTIYKIEKFVEKPDLETAKNYLQDGNFLWNPTLFCWKTKNMMALFEKHHPELFRGLMKIYNGISNGQRDKVVEAVYPTLPKTSIDYAIFEKAENMAVLEADFGWSDVGNWRAVKELQQKNPADNVLKGNIIALESKNNLIYGSDKKLIATCGLENMIVVDTKDALLICPIDQAQNVKKIVSEISKDKKNYL